MSQDTEQFNVRAGAGPLVGPAPRAAIPAILENARREEFLRRFRNEFRPQGPTEDVLVDELARHAVGIEKWDLGGGAVERHGARRHPELAVGLADEETGDFVLAAALTTDAAARCEQQGMRRSRAFLRTLEILRETQSARRVQERAGMPPLGFEDEAACERYLANWLRGGSVCCRQCGADVGYVVGARKRWECGVCHSQTGLRSGTVMARSAVSLRQWFDGVRRLLWQPTIGVAEFAVQVGLRRPGTARSMLTKIRRALAAADAGRQLAGLDQHFARSSRAPEPSVLFSENVGGVRIVECRT